MSDSQQHNDTAAHNHDAEQKITDLEAQLQLWMNKAAKALRENGDSQKEHAHLIEQLATANQQVITLKSRIAELEVQPRVVPSNTLTPAAISDAQGTATQPASKTRTKRKPSSDNLQGAGTPAKQPRTTKRMTLKQIAEHDWLAAKTQLADSGLELDFAALEFTPVCPRGITPVCARGTRLTLEQVGRFIAEADPTACLIPKLNAFAKRDMNSSQWFCLTDALLDAPDEDIAEAGMEMRRMFGRPCVDHPDECIMVCKGLWMGRSFGAKSVLFDKR